MKVLGIVTEYNPIHNGHIYHIQKSKEKTKCDFVIAVMSGSFTESGNIAIYDKFKRAKVAVENGIDLVIELPTVFANSSSEFFASAAITLLDSLNIVDAICFGSEIGDISTLSSISSAITKNKSAIWDGIKKDLETGISFAKAREQSITPFLKENEIKELSKPNNILGIEYLNALDELSSNIVPYTILRENDFNNKNLDTKFTSSTSIREYMYNNCNDCNYSYSNGYNKENLEILKNFVPSSMFSVIAKDTPLFNDNLFDILKYKVITSTKEELANISEVTEGLENRIISSVSISSSYTEFLENIKSKRYQMSKIKRIMINIILDITKDFAMSATPCYAHVLAKSKNGNILLSELSKKTSIPCITSINEKVLNAFDDNARKMLDLDILSSNIHSILTCEKINKDYTNRL